MSSKSLASVIAIAMLAGCAAAEEEEKKEAAAAEETATEEVTPEAKPSEEAKPEAEPTKVSTALSCTNPVKAGDTAKTIMDRYGDDAKLETLAGPEGMAVPGVVLFDGDAKRVIEIGFDDEARTKLSFARVGSGSAWTLASLKTGDGLDSVIKANGKPIKFYGFEWDYSGAVFEYNGGALDKLAGGCVVQMALNFDYDNHTMPDSMMGDSEVSSEAAEVDAKALSIADFGVGFAIGE